MDDEPTGLLRSVLPFVALAFAAEAYMKRDVLMPALSAGDIGIGDEDILPEDEMEEESCGGPSKLKSFLKFAATEVFKNAMASQGISPDMKENVLAEIMTLKDRVTEGMAGGSIPVDVHQTAKEIIIQAELPGVLKEDITLETNEMYLHIAANVKRPTEVPEEDVLVSERTLGLIERDVELPIPVVPQGAKAALDNGILTITLKKSPAVIMREIKLK